MRTKHVSFEPIPSIGEVKGLANYGPTATLFTISKDNWVRQYDLSPPALVKERQILPMEPPLAPQKSARSQGHHIPGTAPPMPVRPSSRSSRQSEGSRGPVPLSTIQRNAELTTIEQARLDRANLTSPISTSSRTDSLSTNSARAYQSRNDGHIPSISTRAASGTTFSTISPSMVGRDSMFSGGTSMYPSTMSLGSSGRRSRGSRLRNELGRSPEESYIDLFPRTRVRLATMAFEPPEPLDQDNMSPEELRRRMLRIVFGWEGDIEDLIRDELRYHQPGSQSAVLLSKWLGEVDSDMMAAAIASGNVSSSDWMILALSQMGGNNPMGKMGQAFVQRLLHQGDFHTSATILLGLGDREDAVEVYVERCFFMEAILLTCLVFPSDWQRQSHLVRRWGEFVVENSQQQLAIRCFTCTGHEPPIPWGSPSPRMAEGSQAPSSISHILSPPSSPPPTQRPPRMTTKNSSLKVITSFDTGPMQKKVRYPGPASTERTPTMGPGITPIAESALSEGNTPINLPPRSGNTNSGRTVTPGAYYRQRLPSIGETPVDVTLPPFRPSQLPTPDNSGSDFEHEKHRNSTKSQPTESTMQAQRNDPPMLLSSARYDPGSTPTKTTPISTSVPGSAIKTTILPSPADDAFIAYQEREKSRGRGSSKDRKPDGLHIRMPSHDQIQMTSYLSKDGIGIGSSEPKTSNTLNSNYSNYSGGLRTGRSDTSAKSPSVSGASLASAKSPSVSGRSLDDYIHSVDAASHHSRKYRSKKRQESKDREGRGEHKVRSKHRDHDRSEDRGRDGKRYIRPAKRSPSSPVPMTPEQYQTETTNGVESEASMMSAEGEGYERQPYGQRQPPAKYRSGSKASDYSQRTIRNRSSDGAYDSQITSEVASHNASRQASRQNSRQGSRQGSRQQSPRGVPEAGRRGRSQSKNRGGSAQRSPSSPLPQAGQRRESDEEDPLRIVEANRQRIRSRQRSRSRQARDSTHPRSRDVSDDRRLKHGERSRRGSGFDEPRSAQEPRSAVEARRNSDLLLKQADEQRRKERAARELEARRESLLRNPDAPPVLHPNEYSRPNTILRSATDVVGASPTGSYKVSATSDRFPTSANTVGSNHSDRSVRSTGYGLPATPRAMRHPRYDAREADNMPAIPNMPDDMQNVPELYYAGGPMRDIPRSLSAPVPEQQQHPYPSELPNHPAFHKALGGRADKRTHALQPLGNIGQQSHRRKGSTDNSSSGGKAHQVTAGITETMLSHPSHHRSSSEQQPESSPPPLLPELQHLSNSSPPAPPPPPPAPVRDPEASSLSSNSNVGAINIVLDDEPGEEANVIEMPPTPRSGSHHYEHHARSPNNLRSPAGGGEYSYKDREREREWEREQLRREAEQQQGQQHYAPQRTGSGGSASHLHLHNHHHHQQGGGGQQQPVLALNTTLPPHPSSSQSASASAHPHSASTAINVSTRSPPPGEAGGGVAGGGGKEGHKRGRSDNFKSGMIKGITGRLRSTSRGRKDKEREREEEGMQGGGGGGKKQSPYESVPRLYF